MFARTPDLFTDTVLGRWRPVGGHRLWVAPESMPGSYAPDDAPVQVVRRDTLSLVLHGGVDAAGMEKSIALDLQPASTLVIVTHRVTNRTCWPVTIASWGITVVEPDGTAVLPQPPRRTHAEQFLPSRRLVQWAYSDFGDPRWHLGRDLLTLTPDPDRGDAQKVGIANGCGWTAVLYEDCTFLTCTRWDPSAHYPDLGCNTELFTAGAYLEVEALGPLTLTQPGHAVTHVEAWMLAGPPPAGLDEAALARWLAAEAAPALDALGSLRPPTGMH